MFVSCCAHWPRTRLISLLFIASAAWLALFPVDGRAADEAVSSTAAASTRPSLLGISCDFEKGDLDGWRHKDNAEISIAESEGKRALRLHSGFAPYEFTWTTRHFEPHTCKGVVHLVFRVRGDGSGHRLSFFLGAPHPEKKRSLYYVNKDQAVTLDFTGWREVSVDLPAFRTPAGGDRERDLQQITFLEFMVHADDASQPLDIQLDDIRFTGYTEAELAEQRRQQAERKEITAEVTASLDEVRKQLDALSGALDEAAKAGKYVDRARVYLAGLRWCADDVQRYLAAEEHDLLLKAPPMLAALRALVDRPEQVLSHVADVAPEEGDPLRYEANPYFQEIIRVTERRARKERFWPKGREGYVAIENAWKFSGMGNRLYTKVWSITRPASPLRHHPMLLRNALNLLDTIAQQHTEGDFNIDRTAIYGRDPNINRFCLAPTLNAWCELLELYPGLLPEAKRKEIEAGLKVLVDYEVETFGLERIASKPHIELPTYPNMDVHHILIVQFAHQLWGEPQYAKERDAFVDMLAKAVYPDGAFTYIYTQNECFVYHHLNVTFSARFWQLTKNPKTLAMLRKTIPYYPYNLEPAGVPEYYTDACWKHYWSGPKAAGPEVIAGLFDDPQNKRAAEISAEVAGYGHGYQAAIAAEFCKPIESQPLPDEYTIFDRNIQGPRGRYGRWSFAGNGRNYGVGYQGKDTFAGCMLTDPERRPLPLDAALQVVTTEVRLDHEQNHWRGGRCHSAQEKLSTTLGPDFGSLAVRYTVSKPNWQHEADVLFPWQGTQQWYLSKDRLVGLVALEATEDEKRAAVHGRIRLGMKREIQRDGPATWRYGKLRVKIHEHNYATILSKPSETFYRDEPDRYRSTEITLIDPKSLAAGEQGEVEYPKGTRYYFLVEVFAEGTKPAEEIALLEGTEAVGFEFREPNRRVVLLHNPNETAISIDQAVGPAEGRAATIYHDNSGEGNSVEAGRLTRQLPPHAQVVVIQ
jgi:ElaB/YqjD/DUF883 family membrane-anchored ribosome-binding protein